VPEDWTRFRRALGEHERERAAEAAERYEQRDELGRGAMSVVYRAWDRKLQREVAMKVVRRDQVRGDAATRFQREVEVTVRLAHPNVVAVYDAGDEGSRMFLVTELVDGRPLDALMRERRHTPDEAARLVEKIARGVAAAHDKGIVHRDLKPGNILITAGGEPKVADFGLAHLMASETALTRDGAVLGTPLYMAPEQVRGDAAAITPRTDVYALGAILYELLTGRPPHTGQTSAELYARVLTDEPVRPRALVGSLPADLEAVCLRALERDASRRYAHAGELADDLARHLAGSPVVARAPGPGDAMGRWRRRHPAAAASAVVAALAIVAIAVVVAGLRASHDRYQTAYSAGMACWERAVRAARADEEAMGESLAYARRHFEEAVRVERRAEALLMLGRARAASGHLEGALEAWTLAVWKDPSCDAARIEIAKYCLDRHARVHATVTHGRVRSGLRESAEARGWRERGEGELKRAGASKLRDGLLAYGEGRLREAADALAAHVAKEPWDAYGFALLGCACYGTGDLAGAELALTRALRFDMPAAWLRARGDVRFARGDFEAALTDYDMASHDADVLCNRGLALNELRRFAEAEKSCGRAIELAPTPRAYNVRGSVRAKRDVDGAEADFRKAIELNAAYVEAYFNLGTLLVVKGEFEEAIGEFDTAIQIDAGFAEAFAGKARAHRMKGDAGKALADLREAARLDPQFAAELREWEK